MRQPRTKLRQDRIIAATRPPDSHRAPRVRSRDERAPVHVPDRREDRREVAALSQGGGELGRVLVGAAQSRLCERSARARVSSGTRERRVAHFSRARSITAGTQSFPGRRPGRPYRRASSAAARLFPQSDLPRWEYTLSMRRSRRAGRHARGCRRTVRHCTNRTARVQ